MRLRRALGVVMCGAAAGAVGLAPDTVRAQQAEAAAQPASEFVIEAIVVTARKREESLQDVPVAITAMSADDLAQTGTVNARELAVSVPGLSWQPATGGGTSAGQYFIRGVGQFDFSNLTDPSVALHLDGVYIARTVGAAIDLIDIERVEVLRGPQGTLFGRNAIAGVINVVTARPGPDFGGTGVVTFGSRDRLDVQASLNVPLNDRLFFRASGGSFSQDGYAQRLPFDTGGRIGQSDGAEVGDVDSQNARAQLRWLATDNLELLLSSDWTRRRQNSGPETLVDFDDDDPLVQYYNAVVLAPQGLPLMTQANFNTGDPYRSYAAARNGDTVDAWGTTLTADLSLSSQTSLKTILAYRELESGLAFDFDGTPYPFSDELVDDRAHQFTGELQLNTRLADERLDLSVGAFYFSESSDQRFALLFTEGAAAVLGPAADFSTIQTPHVENESYAVFAQGTYRLTDRWSTTLGLRYSHETKDLLTSNVTPSGVPIFLDQRRNGEWEDVSPRLGVEWRPADHWLVFASAAKGFRSGGFNARAFFGFGGEGLTAFDPEELWSYEIGFKSDLAGNRLRLNATAFYYDYKDLQISVASEASPVIFIDNAAKVEVYGGELEFIAMPTDRLSLDLSASYIHDAVKEVDVGATDVTSQTDLPNSPTLTWNAAVEYVIPVQALGDLVLRGDAYHRDGHHFLITNSPREYEDGYTLYGARLAFRSRDEHWEVALFGKNLTDERYRILAVDSAGFGGMTVASFGRPREWGVDVKVHF